MKITNLKPGATLAPRLKEVLDLVYAKRPLLEYEVSKYSENDYAESVAVWQDGQMLGMIMSRYKRYSPTNGTNEIWYAMSADTIKKKKGDRDTKYCKDAKTAARTVIGMFTKKTLPELGINLIANVNSVVDSLHTRVSSDYTYSLSFGGAAQVDYLTDVYEGKNPPLPQTVIDQINNKDLLRKKENKAIADNVMQHMKAKNGYCIRVMKDETLLWTHMANPETTGKADSTYSFDQYTQEKFTMLKLLDANQFAKDIGVKCVREDDGKGQTFYFVVAGETKTM